MRILKPAAVYFAVVFGCGFVLGAVRVPLLVPRVGVRSAELIELPIMVAIIVFVARSRQRSTSDLSARTQAMVGAVALAMMLTAEFVLGAVLHGRSPVEVLFARDPVSGSAYYASLTVFAAMPWWWARRMARDASRQQSPP